MIEIHRKSFRKTKKDLERIPEVFWRKPESFFCKNQESLGGPKLTPEDSGRFRNILEPFRMFWRASWAAALARPNSGVPPFGLEAKLTMVARVWGPTALVRRPREEASPPPRSPSLPRAYKYERGQPLTFHLA